MQTEEYNGKVLFNAKKFKKVRFGGPTNTEPIAQDDKTEVAIIGTYQSDEVNNIFMNVDEEEEDVSQQLDDN
jgi:hypothetical protein